MPRRPSNAGDPTAPHFLTSATIALLPVTGTQYRVRDAGAGALAGFAVQVSSMGSIAYTLDYRVRGDRRSYRMTFGRFPAVPAHVARREAAVAKGIAMSGRNPAAERIAETERARIIRSAARAAKKAQRALEHARTLHTVERLATDYLRDRRTQLAASTVGLYESIVRRYLTGTFGRITLPELTQSDVRELLRVVQEGALPAGVVPTKGRTRRIGGEGAARTLRRFLASVWHYAEEERAIVDGASPIPAASRVGLDEATVERFLTADECARLIRILDTAEREGIPPAPNRVRKPSTGLKANRRPHVGVDRPFAANPTAVAALRFALHTGWRRADVLTLRWDMLRRDMNLVILPDTKTDESVRALSPVAWSILEARPKIVGSPWCFPSSRDARKPLADVSRLWDAVRHAAQLPDTRLHDLRHTAASLAINAGASLSEVQSMLGHLSARTTERYAKLLPQTGLRAANKLADALAKAVDVPQSTSVTRLRKPRRRRA